MSELIKIASWSTQPTAAIIFIHGLGGHPYETWQSGSGAETLWPRWLASEVPGVATWTLGYQAPFSNWLGTSMSLRDRAGNILERILGEREIRGVPIVFVCHSLGGLLTKQLLRIADDRRDYDSQAKNLIESVKGIVFFATPHSGSIQATAVERLRFFAWPSAATADLVKNDAALRDLNIWYRNWSANIRHKVFYERKSTAAGLIVGADSADPGLLHVDPIAVDADHINICKPKDRRELSYSRTIDFVLTILDGNRVSDVGTYVTHEIPKLDQQRFSRLIPIVVRLVAILTLSLILFNGVRHFFWPIDPLGRATVEQIQSALKSRSRELTDNEVEQFIRALQALRNVPSFSQAVEEAKSDNTKLAEGLWRQIYTDREKIRNAAQRDQALAARNLAASAIIDNAADGLAWYRKSGALEPDNDATQLGLGDAAMTAGTLNEAEDAFRRFIALSTRKGDSQQRATGLNRLGKVLILQGRLSAASQSYNESHFLIQKLAAADRKNGYLQEKLAASYSDIGDIAKAQGNLVEALGHYNDRLSIARRMAGINSESATWQHQLAGSFDEIGQIQTMQGDLKGAQKSYRNAFAIMQALSAAEPSDLTYQNNLALSFVRVGSVQHLQGNLADARESYNESLQIRTRLASLDATNANWQRNMALVLNDIGSIQFQQGDPDGATESYRRAFDILQRLSLGDSENLLRQVDLSISHNHLGRMAIWRGDYVAAMSSFREAYNIRVRLVSMDSTNAKFQLDLARSLEYIGEAHRRLNDLPSASKAISEASEITQRLIVADHSNAEWQSQLADLKIADATLLADQGDDVNAITKYYEAIIILEKLQKDEANAELKRQVGRASARFTRLLVKTRDSNNPIEGLRFGRSLVEKLIANSPRERWPRLLKWIDEQIEALPK